MIQVEIGDLILNNDTADAGGRKWWLLNWEGWETPDLRQTFSPITSMDGVVIGESQWDKRTIAIEGLCKVGTPTEAAYWDAYNYLLQKLNFRFSEVTFKVHEGSTVKTLGVVLSSKVAIENIGQGSFAFKFVLTAQYPIKTDNTEQSLAYNGSIAPNNTGTYWTWPVIVMDTSGAPTFTNTTVGSAGNTVGFSQDLAAGTIIDFRKRTVTEPGGDGYYKINVAQDDWWPLMPGVNNLTRGGTGNATLYFRHAWI